MNYDTQLLFKLNRVCLHQQVIFLSDVMGASGRAIERKYLAVLEESARSYNEARIRPLTYVSVDRASQAKSVGSNFSLVILFIYSSLSVL